MKKILKAVMTMLSSWHDGKYSGRLISMLDFCRDIITNNPKCYAGQVHGRMNMDNILSNPDGTVFPKRMIEDTDRIKVRILYPSGCSWNNIHTLYEAFSSDDNYQVYVIVDNYPRFIRIMEMVGCQYILHDDYDIKADRPDIFIATYYCGTDARINFSGVHEYVGLMVSAFPNPVMNEKNHLVHWGYVWNAYKYMDVDYYLVDNLVINSLRPYIDEQRLVMMCNPQFDEIYRWAGHHYDAPEGWEKLADKKKVFLWATDHGINESYPTNGFTIDLYLKDMIQYFSTHPEIGLIFRPHPQFIKEGTAHYWKESDLQRLRDFCRQSENIVFDETHDYCYAYDACNAIMVDLNCSISCSALTTGKPICRLKRCDIDEWMISPELEQCYYYARGFDQITSFIEQIVDDNDPLKEIRQEGLKTAIPTFDGNNGVRMKEFIGAAYLRHIKA